ncbi:MAG: hypothetical protein WC554_15255 [Clostridia bacterium]
MKYLILDKEYKNYIKQFFSIAWERSEIKIPPKVLNKEEILIIKKMKKNVDKVHKEWIKGLSNIENK